MSPVADCNLKEYLWGNFESSLVRAFFGCLAVAVRFLHENLVRHKDIKPQNVLVYKGTILLTDFGISRDWTKADRETTTGQTPMTPKYCAPEVADWCPRNSSSDIWSLGCIFLEMFTVTSGFSVSQLFQYLENNGSHSGNYHLNQEGVDSWCKFAWPEAGPSSGPLLWIQNMMKFEKNGRWTAQRLSDCIQEQSEDGEFSYVGECCDTSIGSPQTVDSPPTGSTMQLDTAVPDAEASRQSSIPDNSTIGSLDFGHLAVASTPMDSRRCESSGPRENQVEQHRRNSTKRAFPTVGRNVGGKKIKRGQRQQMKDSDEHQKGNENPEFPSRQPPVNMGKHVEEDVPKELPVSFQIAQSNRLSREQVLGFIAAYQNTESLTSRSMRVARGSEKIMFCYGDYMLPDVVYAETCVRSKPSQYARWSTLEGLVRHMTPATLYGYSRFCPDTSEGLKSIPTVKATESPTDEVRGMLIFGWHDSHTQGNRKHESEHEHDMVEGVILELQDRNTMTVEATLRVWNEDVTDALTPYSPTWIPQHMLQGERYALIPKSVRMEDEKLKASVFGNIANRGTVSSSSQRTLRNRNTKLLSSVRGRSMQGEVMLQEKAMSKTYQNRDGGVELTQDVIGELFYSGVTQSTQLDHLCLSPH
jgi:serine/threonine protein kinase